MREGVGPRSVYRLYLRPGPSRTPADRTRRRVVRTRVEKEREASLSRRVSWRRDVSELITGVLVCVTEVSKEHHYDRGKTITDPTPPTGKTFQETFFVHLRSRSEE